MLSTRSRFIQVSPICIHMAQLLLMPALYQTRATRAPIPRAGKSHLQKQPVFTLWVISILLPGPHRHGYALIGDRGVCENRGGFMQRKAKSQWVHFTETYYRSGKPATVFRALQALPCYGCNKDIETGAVFLRSADKVGNVPGLRYTFCGSCRPLDAPT